MKKTIRILLAMSISICSCRTVAFNSHGKVRCVTNWRKMTPLLDSLYRLNINDSKWRYVDCVEYKDTLYLVNTKPKGKVHDFNISVVVDKKSNIVDVFFSFKVRGKRR